MIAVGAHKFTDNAFAFAIGINIGGIDKIAARIGKRLHHATGMVFVLAAAALVRWPVC